MRGILLLMVLGATFGLSAGSVAATCGGLVGQITLANATGGNQTISLPANCTETVTQTMVIQPGLTLTINGNGATFDFNTMNAIRGFDVQAGATLVLRDVTIQNARDYAFWNTGDLRLIDSRLVENDPNVATIYNQATLTVTDAEWFNNTGIVLLHASSSDRVSLNRVTAQGNQPFPGHIISANGPLTIRDSDFEMNTNVIQAQADLQVERSTFSDNQAASDGGAIWHSGASLTVTGGRWHGNVAPGDGGAIYTSGALVATNATFDGNVAGDDGGGIYAGGEVTLTQSALIGNDATLGGGVYAVGAVYVERSTIVDNAFGGVISPDFHLARSLLAENGPSLASQAIQSGGDNLIGDSLPGAVETDIIEPYPGLALPVEEDGLLILRPTRNSPALDAIPCNATTDIRGLPRAVDLPSVENGRGTCDIGAVEVQSEIPACADGTPREDVLVCAVDLPDVSNDDTTLATFDADDQITVEPGLMIPDITTGAGDDRLLLRSGISVNTVDLGAGDDWMRLEDGLQGSLVALEGGPGFDRLELTTQTIPPATLQALADSIRAGATVITFDSVLVTLSGFEQIRVLNQVIVTEQALYNALAESLAQSSETITFALPDMTTDGLQVTARLADGTTGRFVVQATADDGILVLRLAGWSVDVPTHFREAVNREFLPALAAALNTFNPTGQAIPAVDRYPTRWILYAQF
jgi:predicted outer membrane repeat protein